VDSCSHNVEHAPGYQVRVFGLRQPGEDVLERRFIVTFAETSDGIVRHDAAFAEDKNFAADLLDYFEQMRAARDPGFGLPRVLGTRDVKLRPHDTNRHRD